MTLAIILDALDLPAGSRIDQRVPKKLLVENGAPTAADKRQINEGIEHIQWVAALKPTNIGVPEYRDTIREYLELAVLTATLRAAAKSTRLIELIHRAIPYPVVLVTVLNDTVSLSLAHKRWSQGEAGKVVIENIYGTAPFCPEALTAEESLFLASLAISNLPRSDLFALYQGLIDRVSALEAAQITGVFAPPDTADRSTILHDGLETHVRLQRNIAELRTRAVKEKQINRRVEINLEIKRLEAELIAITKTL